MTHAQKGGHAFFRLQAKILSFSGLIPYDARHLASRASAIHALKVEHPLASSAGKVSPLGRSRFDVDILDERHFIASFAVYKLIYESLGHQNAKATWAHAARLTVFDVA